MSDSTGRPTDAVSDRICNNPASASVWPALSSTAVSTHRCLTPGIVLPLMVTVNEGSISLMYGLTSSQMRLSPRTLATKSSLVPNSLNVTDGGCPRPVGTKIGNSPPELKLAGLPSTATTVGSAINLASFFSLNARKRPKKALPLSTIPNLIVSLPALVKVGVALPGAISPLTD